MKKKSGRKPRMPDRNTFEMLYYNQQTKAEDIAEMYEVSKQTVYNWAYKYRIERNKILKNIY